MNRDIFYRNEIELAQSSFKSDYSDFVIIGDENSYLFGVLSDIFRAFSDGSFRKTCVISVLYGSDNKVNILEKTSDAVNQNNCHRCIICDENTLPVSEKGYYIAEREYLYLADKNITEAVKNISDKVPTVFLVCDEIIGPGLKLKDEFCFADNRIVISDDDCKTTSGYTYIRDIVASIFMAINKLEEKNIYNVSSFAVSDCEMKQKIHQIFCDKFFLQSSLSPCNDKKIKALSPLKIKSKGFTGTEVDTALYLTVSSHFGYEYDYNKNLAQYCSKLDILKKTELEILKEIDRICKKHDIRYFLTGGTLLGAVRYGKSIPWDDDLDIGMLRADFEKFRKICPEEINKTKFAYASYTTEENCHYLFDKIRLKNTYFSTAFSSQYKIQDGVFVDIFVYDSTSPSLRNQKLHINLVKTAIRFLNIRWTGKADRTMNGYLFSRVAMPLVKMIPFNMLHKFSDKMLMFYNRKNSDYLIDGTGLNINRGAFKKELLEDLTEMDFEGFSAPVPQNYDGFLRHVYGENYLEEPALFRRSGTHDFVRLDLGEYIDENSIISNEQSLDGEFY